MTKNEAAIVSAYTGIVLGEWEPMLDYIEKILGRRVAIQDLPSLVKEIHEASREDFISIETI